jgi:hypothetical protein
MLEVMTPERGARLLLAAMRNVVSRRLAKRDDTPLHRAADSRLKPMLLAVQAAFNLGKEALGKPPDAKRAAAAVRSALLKTLPPAILGTMKVGGDAGLEELHKKFGYKANGVVK